MFSRGDKTGRGGTFFGHLYSRSHEMSHTEIRWQLWNSYKNFHYKWSTLTKFYKILSLPMSLCLNATLDLSKQNLGENAGWWLPVISINLWNSYKSLHYKWVWTNQRDEGLVNILSEGSFKFWVWPENGEAVYWEENWCTHKVYKPHSLKLVQWRFL